MNRQRARLLTIFLAAAIVVGLIGTLSSESPAEAQSGPSCGAGLWDTTYFNDTNLITTAYIGCTASVQLNQGLFWGTGGPVGGVGPNNFSGRFVTNITFVSAGTYRFTSAFQDGARLYINGQLTTINFWGQDIGAAQTQFADYYVPAPNTTVTVVLEVVKFTGNGQINLNWALSGGGGFPSPTPMPQANPWTVEYYNNRTFTPPAIYGPQIPGGPLALDWQLSAPYGGVNADEWSSRFTSVVTFPTGGVVTFEARADDTVTVYVDGQVVTASAPYFVETTYTGQVNLTPGSHTIVVEHTDIELQAYLYVSWNYGGGDGGDDGTQTGITGTVTATAGLNFRDAPSITGNRIRRLNYGEVYPVIGRNADSTWAYLDVNGVKGWSYARWLQFSGDFNSVPVVDGSGGGGGGGAVVMQARPVGNMRIRDCPSFSCARLGYVPWGELVDVYGQSADFRWIKIEYRVGASSIVGWSYKLWYREPNDLTQSLPGTLPIVQ